ncbi:hypothetical protein [Maricaulis sp.]|uniref:hypothetical protein n=1 Tax=Maricaulis sp. TaxID=1486257 RepID=UPI003A8D51E6
MLCLIAATLLLQTAQTGPAEDAAPAPADAIAETPAPPPTDATTLIARFDEQYEAWGDLVAELAGRKARERYLAELLLPVITRSDLDDGASGEILRETRDTISEVETANTRWAIAQLDPDRFAALELAQPRLAADILRWAERDESGRGRVIAALEPVALTGRYDPQAFAEMADAFAIAESRPQIYGTVSTCVEGHREPAPLRAPDNLDARRIALGLAPMAEAWAALIAAEGETCEPSPSP